MKLSYNWLSEYVDCTMPPEELAQILVDIGLEVEGMETIHSIEGGMEGFVTGEVKTCAKHHNADKLSVTMVDIGIGRDLHIVCGAPNIAAGQKVVVATIGTIIYKGEESFEIKKAKIRGEESEGMICAEDELGIGESHAGILVLDADTMVGMKASEFFKVEKDTVYEIGLTPNRIDSGSHYGASRDLAAFLSQKIPVKSRKPFVDEFRTDSRNLSIDVVIENSEACPRYAGVTLSGVEVKPSPEWLQKRLKSIGLNPINNIVDVTNFVLHELGQPLHAFDADQIKGGKIVVKCLDEGTSFITLDGVEHKLSSEDLMICNMEEGMAIGGVFGGLHSGINEQTSKIFIESAYFNPVSVRKTAKRHGLSTDASFHFERGTDPNMVLFALKRAALLIKEVGGGSITSEIIDRYPKPVADFIVEASWERMFSLIGKKIDKSIVKQILSSLEIVVEQEEDDKLVFRVPPYHVDVKKEADIVEEILRIYGFNNIEFPDKVNTVLSYTPRPDKEKIINTISDYLSAMGFAEIMSNSLTKSSYYEKCDSFPGSKLVHIINPLSNDLNGMRQTLFFGGMEAILFNSNHKNPNLKMYEFGNVYLLGKGTADESLSKYSEAQHLALFITGNVNEQSWTNPEKVTSFYTLRAAVSFILDKLGITESTIKSEEFESDIFAEALRYKVQGKVLVEYGIVSKHWLTSFDLKNPVYYADIHWDLVMKLLNEIKILYKEIPKYPDVRRDLSLMVDEGTKFADLKRLAFETGKTLLRRVDLFDVYMGDQVEKGKKSYTLSFILQDPSKTLTDQEIDKIMNSIAKAYSEKLSAVIRK
jgi:phenylalanyl-tRNA synthetase beta chain